MKNLVITGLFVSILFLSCNKNFEEYAEFASGAVNTNNCSGKIRFRDIVFPLSEIQIDTGIIFKDPISNHYKDSDLLKTKLNYDFYQPKRDSNFLRPLIILLHGGGFSDISSNNKNMAFEATRFAQYGYCVAAINYRIDPGLKNSTVTATDVYRAIYRAVQDARFAVRRAKAEAAFAKLDTNYFFMGGISAGAITSLHVAYLDDGEISSSILNVADYGNLDFGGYNQYSAKIKGVFSHAGGLTGLEMIKAGDVPAFTLMSKKDTYFPDSCGIEYTYKRIYFCGAREVEKTLNNLNIPNKRILLTDSLETNIPTGMLTHGSVFGVFSTDNTVIQKYQARDVDSTAKWLYQTFSPNPCTVNN